MNHSTTANNQFPEIVKNYLYKHGHAAWSLVTTPGKKFNNIIVIPAIEEFKNVKRLLDSLVCSDRKYFAESLFLFVVNNLASSEEHVKRDNRNTINFLHGVIHKTVEESITRSIINCGMNVGYVNASSEGLEMPERDGGVGLARKIGMDLALTVFDYSSYRKKILICLDADCTVENNYLTSIVNLFNQSNVRAGYIQYEHKLPEEPKQKLAIICYEIFLRYYLLGLSYAGSPFAFATIGSTMVCDYESYIKVGGMNKKKAAEDFYFMEKLGKVTRVEKIDSTKVYPSSRASWRVPFGTGQRVNRFLKEAQDEYVLYNPEIFVVLKNWIDIFHSEEILEGELYLKLAKKIDPSLHEFLVQNKFEESWNKILSGSKSKEQIMKQKLMWFDGFRTLKLTHFLRDNAYPLANMFDALDKLIALENVADRHLDNELKIGRTENIPGLETQLAYLNLLRKLS